MPEPMSKPELSSATVKAIDALRAGGPFDDMRAMVKATVTFPVPLSDGICMQITLRDEVSLDRNTWSGLLMGDDGQVDRPSEASYYIEITAPLDDAPDRNAFEYEGVRLMDLDDIRERGDFDMDDAELESKLSNTDLRSLETHAVAMSGRKVDYAALIRFAHAMAAPDRQPEVDDALRVVVGNGDVFDLYGTLKATSLSLSSKQVFDMPVLAHMTHRLPELIDAGVFYWSTEKQKEAVEDRLHAPSQMRHVNLQHDGSLVTAIAQAMSDEARLWSPQLNGRQGEFLERYLEALCEKKGISLNLEGSTLRS